MQLLSAFFLPLIVSVLLGGLVCLLAGRPFGQALPAAYLGAGLAIYLGTLLTGRFSVGCLLVLAAALAGAVLLALRARHGGRAAVLPLVLTPGLAAFLLLYTYLFFLHTGRSFQWWDEYSHWGPMVKEILRTDAFYSARTSVLAIHRDYPPFFPLLEAAWCRLCGGYAEPALCRCLLTVELSLFLPMFETSAPVRRPLLRVGRIVCGCVLVVLGCSVICGDIPFFTSIYLDYPLALLLAYGLCCIVLEDAPSPFQGVCLALAGAALLLTKQMGLAFYLMLAGLLTACCLWQLIRTPAGGRKSLLKAQAAVWLPAVLAPPLLSLSWSRYIAGLDLSGQFSVSGMNVGQLSGILDGSAGLEYQQITAQNFITAYFHKNIWAGGAGRMEFPYIQVTAMFALALVMLTALAFFTRFAPARFVLLDLVLLGGSVCYALLMLVSYLSGFSEYEAPRLASYCRYMNTYWFAAAAVIIMLFFAAVQRLKPWLLFGLCGAAALVITAELLWEQPGNLRNLLPDPYDPASPSVVYQGDAAILLANTPPDARVFVVDQNSDGFSTHVLRYLTWPRTVNEGYFSVGEPYGDRDAWTVNCTPQQYAAQLVQYDYLYIVHADYQYLVAYGPLLPDIARGGYLYRISSADPPVFARVGHD